MAEKNKYHRVKYVDEKNNIDMDIIFAFEQTWLSAEQIATFFELPVEEVQLVLKSIEKSDRKLYHDWFCIECEFVDRDKRVSRENLYDAVDAFNYVATYISNSKPDYKPTEVTKDFYAWQRHQCTNFDDMDYLKENKKISKNKVKDTVKAAPKNLEDRVLKVISDWLFSRRTIVAFFWLGMIFYNRHDGYGSLLVDGEDPQLSVSCLISIFGMALIICWLTYNHYRKEKDDNENHKQTPWLTMTLIALLAVLVHSYLYSLYYDGIKDDMLKSSHKCEGYVYEKESYWGRNAVSVGIDKNHTFRHIVNNDIAESVNVGDVVMLRVSDEYSRINKVINWEDKR